MCLTIVQILDFYGSDCRLAVFSSAQRFCHRFQTAEFGCVGQTPQVVFVKKKTHLFNPHKKKETFELDHQNDKLVQQKLDI